MADATRRHLLGRPVPGPFCIYVYVEATTKADERFCAASPWVRPAQKDGPCNGAARKA